MSTLVEKLCAARKCSVPLVAISTPDPATTMQEIADGISEDDKPIPKICWDIVKGFSEVNKTGKAMLDTRMNDPCEGDPVSALKVLLKNTDEESLIFFMQANRYLDSPSVMQAAWNLRDQFKKNRRMLVMLGPSFAFPEELASDVISFDEPYPGDEELKGITQQVFKNAHGLEFKPDNELLSDIAASVKGCSAFVAEQLVAMSLRKKEVDMEQLDAQARKVIEQTPGLSFEPGKETFNDVGGLGWAKKFGTRMFAGPAKPRVIVRVEELEKAMAGSTGGDLSGTSSDALQVLLSSLEDNDWNGMLAFGAPGSGKSLFAKSLANSHGAKAIRFDINACKASLVGESGKRIRQAMKVLKTLGGSQVFFIASVNKLDTIPPELQRRFRAGTWFFDIPSDQELESIWEINTKRYDLATSKQYRPKESMLTGADVRNICEMAYNLDCTLKEAMGYVVPLKTQSPRSITAARETAEGQFISANHGGVYKCENAQANGHARKGKRSVNVG